ncbi:hypothetical protein SAMN05518672_104126 [Chitinophaga sp. CF118]|uniref:hypothetical protein n=1 Tax=Chitinophaga sp. CF118 TaxID=1884367 RepID=UPI0008EB453A|nr:hypothetical protein [Chitinophaga sp. CF118]SFE00880.1 hypothetical protein SAMN05518672_104126 [Chitinophaga sp. CF118]
MALVFIIILRILFIASMVFIIGYVFGGFSKKPSLSIITKVAVILVIFLFIATNILLMSIAFRHADGRGPWHCNQEVKEERHVGN